MRCPNKRLIGVTLALVCLTGFADAFSLKSFQDPQIRSELQALLPDKDPKHLKQSLKSIRKLVLPNAKVASLDGFQYLQALETLQMPHNFITSVTYLKSLPQLQIVDLRDNEIKNALPLTSHPQLTVLNLSSNKLTHMFSCRFQQLTALDISDNQIEQLFCFKNYNSTLAVLNVSKNPLKDIQNPYLPSLTTLYANETLLSDITPLLNFKQLEVLELQHCIHLTSIQPLFKKTLTVTGYHYECVLQNLHTLKISTAFLDQPSQHILQEILNGKIIKTFHLNEHTIEPNKRSLFHSKSPKTSSKNTPEPTTPPSNMVLPH